MSLQVAILKVLSAHPQKRASVTKLNSDLRILAGCKDWNERMKRLAARMPNLDIFGQQLVLRDISGWQLTAAGGAALEAMETPSTSGLSKGDDRQQPGPKLELSVQLKPAGKAWTEQAIVTGCADPQVDCPASNGFIEAEQATSQKLSSRARRQLRRPNGRLIALEMDDGQRSDTEASRRSIGPSRRVR